MWPRATVKRGSVIIRSKLDISDYEHMFSFCRNFGFWVTAFDGGKPRELQSTESDPGRPLETDLVPFRGQARKVTPGEPETLQETPGSRKFPRGFSVKLDPGMLPLGFGKPRATELENWRSRDDFSAKSSSEIASRGPPGRAPERPRGDRVLALGLFLLLGKTCRQAFQEIRLYA